MARGINRLMQRVVAGFVPVALVCVALHSPAWAEDDPPGTTPGQFKGVETKTPAKKTAKAKKAAVAPEDLPDSIDPSLSCRKLGIQTPHLLLLAKTKTGEKYEQVQLGCITFEDGRSELTDAAKQGVDKIATHLGTLKNVIRLYLDLMVPPFSAKESEKNYRQQAFAVKKTLTERGVFAQLQGNRETAMADKAPDKPMVVAATGTGDKTKVSAPAAAKAPSKPRDVSQDYTYHVNKSNVTFVDGDPALYGSPGTGPFQFIPLENVYFVFDKDHLTDRAQATLDAVTEYVMKNRDLERIIVRGHADEVGSDNYNFKLTDRRATNVRNYLVANGVPVSLLEVMSAGEAAPTDESWTRQGQARNRRVELYAVLRTPATTP